MDQKAAKETDSQEFRIMRTPREVDIEITSRCNLRCRYCYYFDNPAVSYNDIPTEEWLRFFNELSDCAVMRITLQGGEPFIRRDLPQLISGIVRNRMRFAILSNGTLIDESIAAVLAHTGRCDYVQVSIDGSGPETHDACRGPGTFHAAIRGINILKRYGVNVTVRATIHRKNVHDLENISRFILEDLGLSGFSINSAGYFGTCRLNTHEVLLTTAERQQAMTRLTRLNEKYKGRIWATAGPLADSEYWQRMEEALQLSGPPFPEGGRLTGCGCPFSRISVRADGIMVPCAMLAHMELGRINKNSLTDIWHHSADLNRLRRRRSISLSEFEFCKNCPYIPYCTGNCPGLAYTLTGHVDHPSPDACLRRFLSEGGTLPRKARYPESQMPEKRSIKTAP
jgi:SynChlorMet cassette radical SAM/SPASM protein ScmE